MHLAESTENPELPASGLDWSFWLHFEPRWTISPRERAWLRGTGDVVVARGVALFAATVVGISSVAMGAESLLLRHDAAGTQGVAVGLAYLVLGGCVCRGKRWASLGLMALFTVERTAGNLMAYLHGAPYYTAHPSFWLGEGLVAWAAWMRIYYVAYRAEQRQPESLSR